jgi:cbb3-type cytochrome oxidase maturation protein
MSVIVLLIVAGGTVAAGFLAAFVWAVRSGQFDDTCTPAIRVLLEDRGRPPRPAPDTPVTTTETMRTESRGWL